jgi:hypothetical protein
MTHAEAIAAIDLILTRAEKVDMGRQLRAWIYVRVDELARAKEALEVLSVGPLDRQP